jgi:DNA repair exonuclease SbcCD nuclease subunit
MKKAATNKPIAVLISDIHYNIQTLDIADKALRLAISKANDLEVPVIIAGDLHDTKANLRGECVLALINTIQLCNQPPYILRGNHDSLNEKSKEHSLEFLGPYSHMVKDNATTNLGDRHVYLIPYEHHTEVLKAHLKTVKKGSILIMHQGVEHSHAGHYIQDKTALSRDDYKGLRIISGHYHRRQTIDLPKGGQCFIMMVALNSFLQTYVST